MKALLRVTVILADSEGSSNSGYAEIEKEISLPYEPKVGMHISEFEVYSELDDYLKETSKKGEFCDDSGLDIEGVDFILRGNALIPTAYMRVEYYRTEEHEVWKDLTLSQVFDKFFKPTCENYGFRICYSSFSDRAT